MLSTNQLNTRLLFMSDIFNIEFPQPFSNIYYNLNTNIISSLSTNVYRIIHSSTLEGSNKYIRSYISNPTLWVACGDDTVPEAKLQYSTDGMNWSNSTGETFSGPAYGASFNDQLQRWVAVGSNTTSAGTIKTSTDGLFWQNCMSGAFETQGNGVASGYDSNGDPIFVAVGTSTNSSNVVKYSTNGFDWINTNYSVFSNATAVSFSGRSWIVSGNASINFSGSNYVDPTVAYSYTSNFPNFFIYTGFYYQCYGGTGTPITSYYRTATLCNGTNSFGYTSSFASINAATNNYITSATTGPYTIIWTGHIYAPVTGTYGFGLYASNLAYVWIGDNALRNFTTANSALNIQNNSTITTCNFTANTFYPVRIQHMYSSSTGNFRFYSSNPGSAAYSCNIALASQSPVGISRAVSWNGLNFITTGSSNVKLINNTTNNNFLPNSFGFANGNGDNWSSNITGGFNTQGYGVAGNEKLWVAVGDGTITNQTIQYSTDNGANWTNVLANGFNTSGGRGVVWGDSMFVAVGDATASNERIKYSTNGSNWTNASYGGFNVAANYVAYSKLYTPNLTTTGLEVLGQNQVYLSDSNSLTTPQSQTIFRTAPSTFIMGNTIVLFNQSTLITSNATQFDLPEYTLDVNGTLGTSCNNPTKPSGGTWTITSDMRLKTNIVSTSIDSCYEVVKQIPLYHYRFRDEFYRVYGVNDRAILGFLAQDVKPYFPNAVTELPDNTFGLGSILTLNITPLLNAQYGAAQKLIRLNENRLPTFEYLKGAYESTISQVPESFYSTARDVSATYDMYVHASTTMHLAEQQYDIQIEEQTKRLETLRQSYELLTSKVSTLEAFSQSLSQPPPTTE